MSIPARGWGAVEAVIWEYKSWTERAGHEFLIVNTKDKQEIVRSVNQLRPDVVHIHCEAFFSLAPYLDARLRILTSHWPWLFDKRNERRARAHFAGPTYGCCLSPVIHKRCVEMGIPDERLFIARNGARPESYHWKEHPRHADRTICLAMVNRRKRQCLLKNIGCVDFVGPLHRKCLKFGRHSNYLGAWDRSKVYRELTDYASLVLLSEIEAAPLVTCEALMAGLGVVVSPSAAANLDLAQPFITVVPEDKVKDTAFVRDALRRNREVALRMRREIRQYAIESFSWEKLVSEYLRNVSGLLDRDDAIPVREPFIERAGILRRLARRCFWSGRAGHF